MSPTDAQFLLRVMWPSVQIIAAARQLQATMEKNVRVRFDPDHKPALQTELLAAL